MNIRLRSSGGRISTFFLSKLASERDAATLREERKSRIVARILDAETNGAARLAAASGDPLAFLYGSKQAELAGGSFGVERSESTENIDLRAATLQRLDAMCACPSGREAELAFRAHHDALTGLPNRHAFETLTSQGLAYARRYGRPLAILFIDLDGFKSVNDTFGHACGDAVLQQVAHRFRSVLRQSDTIARWGGDEFVVGLLEVGSAGDAWRAAEKLLNALKDPLSVDGRSISLSASIGISIYPEDGADLKTLIEKADQAMYEGRRVATRQSHDGSCQDATGEGRARLVESQLRFALQRGEFFLHYQPQFDLHTGAVCAVEALIRWQHPRLGLMQAGSFLPLAQTSRLILPISAWTLETACSHFAGFSRSSARALRVAVNVSAAQFYQEDFVSEVVAALDRTGADPHFLELDLPEEALTQDLEAANRKLAQLRQLGIRLAADDFGSTYTSLDYIQRLPLDSLKLHPSLIRGLAPEQRPLLIESIIALAQSASVRAVAEGVETMQELNVVRSAGCDAAQGYLLAMPAPVEEVLAASGVHSLAF